MEALKKQFQKDAAVLRERRVKPIWEIKEAKRRKVVRLRMLSGEDVVVDTLVANSTFRDLYTEARKKLGICTRGSPLSLRLSYVGWPNTKDTRQHAFAPGDTIPCNDYLCYNALKGSILAAIVHK